MMRAAGLSREVRDGDWTLMQWDPATGRTVWALHDSDRMVLRTDTPVAASIEANTTHRNAAREGWTGDYHRIASVPMQLLYDPSVGLNTAIQQGDDAYLSRWLNDSDNRAWRTKEGRV